MIKFSLSGEGGEQILFGISKKQYEFALKMHLFSSSQKLKKQKIVWIRSENAFFEFQRNAKKSKKKVKP